MALQTNTKVLVKEKNDGKQRVINLVLKLQKDAQSDFKENTNNVRGEMQDCFNNGQDVDVNAFIDSKFDNLNQKFLQYSNSLRKQVKSNAPKEPVRQNYESNEDYDRAYEDYTHEKADYLVFVSWVSTVIDRLAKWLKKLFDKIKEFFTNLWNWIKAKLQDIAERVKQFLAFVGDQFSGLVRFVFQNN